MNSNEFVKGLAPNCSLMQHSDFHLGVQDGVPSDWRATRTVQVAHRHKHGISDFPVLISGIDPLLAMDERLGGQTAPLVPPARGGWRRSQGAYCLGRCDRSY